MSGSLAEGSSSSGNAAATKTSKGKRGSGSSTHVPVYKKYAGTQVNSWLDPSAKLRPSDLEKPMLNVVAEDYPMIIELSNLKDNSTQVHSTVDSDQPLFRPAPKIVVFEEYAPFAVHEKKLFFRNNDSVARRIKLIQPDTPFFEMSAPRLANGEPLQQSKIAAGIEIFFVVKFKPQEVRDYSWDLVCCTEREKFVVPIRAIGTRPRITFPDEVNFGTCPVKSGFRKMLLVQNVGTSSARFTMRSLMSVYGCPGEEMVVEPGASQMLELFFTPPTAHLFQGEIEVDFGKGVKCFIECLGTGKNVDVSLSTPSLALEPSYISLVSQKTFRIRNQSESPIKFTWKSFYCEEDEEAERARLLLEIDRMEEIEHKLLAQRVQEGFYNNAGEGDDFDADAGDDDMGLQGVDRGAGDELPFAARAEEAALVRKYRNLRRALETDAMQFVDDVFELSPVHGQVWANSELEVTVNFRPDTAAMYTCLGFLDVAGRQDRLTLNMSGQGIGPHATLSFDVLDVGDIFIHDEQRYEIFLSNKGDIPAQWTFMSSLTRFGTKFKFFPTEGYLMPGQSQPISITFESDVLGEFCESFRFALQGNEDMLVCQIKGHVLGPTFHFDTTSINFGVVSFDYLHSCNLRLVNTSKIAMAFNLHIPQDGTYVKKEFNIEPSEGTLSPGQHMDILLEFIPSSVKVYDYSLAVDVLGIGDIILSVPISAECIVSTVALSTREIDFGECFIRYPYEKVLTLTNLSDQVHTKFEMLPQMAFTRATATYECEPSVAVIEPKDSLEVTIRLVAEKLGQFKIPISVAVAGSQEPPIQAVLVFTVVGPRIITDQPEVKWGAIECLRDSARSLVITNDGLIQASMKLFLKQARSKFEMPIRELILDPQDSYELFINANIDDSVVVKDELHILVEESDNLMVPLSAKGIGTTISCAQDIKMIHMGTQLTNTTFEKRIVLENKGRRPQALKWINATIRDENTRRAELAKNENKEPGRLPKHLSPKDPLFTVTPEEIVLRPRTATTFTFKGRCDTPGQASETFILESRIGKDRIFKPIIETLLQCDVINPLLEFSEKEVSFVYAWERGVEAAVQRRDLVLTNSTAVPLSFVLKTEVPFNLNSWEHTLAPGEAAELVLDFDPMYKDEKTSHTVEKSLVIAYRGHPQKDSIPLRGEIIFPNLSFETRDVKFGCVLNDTSKTVLVKLTNPSKVVTTYEWNFGPSPPQTGSPNKKGSLLSMGKANPSVQNFDVLPIRSVLQPGESEDVQFTMFGAANTKVSAQAFCCVEGGPEYKLNMTGEASTVAFALDRSVVDFGKVVWTDKADQELILTNTGKVTFPFRFEFKNPAAAELIEIAPFEGKVAAGEKLKVVLTVRPGLPEVLAEPIVVHVAHFDPALVTAYCTPTFPSCVVTLPRQKKISPYGGAEQAGGVQSAWADFIKLCTTSLTLPDETKLPPFTDRLPPPASGDSSWAPVYETPRDEDEEEGAGAASSSGSVAGTIAAPSQTLLEVEMHRQVTVALIADKIRDKKIALLAEAEAAAAAAAAAANQTLDATPVNDKKKKKGTQVIKKETLKGKTGKGEEEVVFQGQQYFIARHIELKDVVVANYLCDFGNVILGQTRKRVFRINNASSSGQLTFNLDASAIANNGFSIEPNKVAKMIEGDGMDFAVKLTARTNMKVGRKTSILPVINKGSPTVNIVLTGNVCIPEIELSTESINMEKVLVGRSKKVYVRLTNTCPVTASWSFKKTGETRISITPSEGSLRAGKKAIVCVEFIPTEAKKVSLETVFKIDNNSKTKTFKIVGEGVGAVVKFDSNLMEIGPVVPFTDGESKIITLTNFSDFPVEVYSLDFDTVYKEDDAALVGMDLYDRDNLYRSAPRGAGELLPEAVHASVAAAQAAVAAAAAAAEKAAAREQGGEEEAPVEAEAPTSLSAAPVRSIPGPRDEGLHQDVLVAGPPLSGVSTLASSIGKKLQLPVRKIDDILQDIALTDGPEGSTARRCTKSMTESEAAAVAAQEDDLRAKAEASTKAAEDAFKADKKNKGKEVPPEVLDTPEAQAFKAFAASGSLTTDTLTSLLSFRLGWQDAAYGLVIDSASSSLVAAPDALAALQAVMPKAIVANITVAGGEAAFASRLSALYSSKIVEVERLSASITSQIKAAVKAAATADKKATKKGATQDISQPPVNPYEIQFAVPSGDEPWVNPETGLIVKLDSQDIKALEEPQKAAYSRQLLYFQHSSLQSAREVLAKIARIWSPEHGLKTELDAPPAAEPEAEAKAATAVAEGEAAPAAAEGEAPASEQQLTETESASALAAAQTLASSDLSATLEPTLLLADPPVLYCDYIANVAPLISALFPDPEPVVPEAAAAAVGDGAEVAEAEAAGAEAAGPVVPAEPLPRDSGVWEVSIEGDESEEAVFNTIMALLPAAKIAPLDKDAVPSTTVHQVYKRPYPRSEPRPIRVYSIERVEPEPPAVVDGEAPTAEEGGAPAYVFPASRSPYRWIIAPNGGTVQMKIVFKSTTEGKFDSTLAFEVLGSQQTFSLFCKGICEVPKINNDSRNVFMRRVKGLPSAPAAPPSKRFAMADNLYSFGPLLVFKKPEWRLSGDSDEAKANLALVQTTNTDIVRITNNGRYRCSVEMGYEDADPEAAGVFLVEPAEFELDEGETKDVRVWAFPPAVKQYKNTLLACVKDNPVPVRFDVAAWGAEPTIDIDGPWGEALREAEAAVAACADKKLLKPLEDKVAELKAAFTLDFDRLLVKKTDVRTFEIKSTSLLPVAWEVDLGEFASSEFMTITPASGVLPVGGAQVISLSFTSPEPMMLSGKFGLRFSDNEKGLASGRAQTRSFRAVGEAYNIQAVSLNSAGSEGGGSEVDFGTLRVGDFASQTIKIGNKGKYKIGYKLVISKPSMAALIAIEPSEGTIEPGTALAEVKLTFCAKGGEVLLKGNKDVKVQISEPTTGEVVETFPLYLSANAKYNKFRIQPSKGISFGSMRFDAAPRVKRVEIRNEGPFDATFVVCSKSAEVDELDALDPATLASYAFGIPAAMRAAELGEGYFERIAGKGAAGKDAKAAPPAKGKDAKGGAAPAAASGNTNPLVVDPDALVAAPAPDAPLAVGAFTVTPRCGVVSPGQVVAIEIKFDPSGCTVSKEQLRVCYSGSDPKDGLTQVLRSFEIAGDSCFPAIVNDDMQSIFEEQEVVLDLLTASGPGEDQAGGGGGGGKFEKIPPGKVVYAETEKMLAFGPVMCGLTGAKGVVERIRITNPTKVDTKVRLRIISPEAAAELEAASKGGAAAKDAKGKDAKAAPPAKGKDAKGGAEAAEVVSAFSVQPEVWDIPPHEHRFVNIYFNPTEIRSYRSVFVAEVDLEGAETSAQPKGEQTGKSLVFGLGGSGTLPSIAVEQPTERGADGSLSVDFGKTHVNRTSRRKLVLRNGGAMPATCLFDMTGDDDFVFPYSNSSLTVAPGEKKEINISFCPKRVFGGGERGSAIKISVLNNAYDQYSIKLKASAYACDAVLDIKADKPKEDEAGPSEESKGSEAADGAESEDKGANEELVTFPEINLSEGPGSSTRTITLRSSSAYPLKFDLAVPEGVPKVFSFSPSRGHLGPKGKRVITCTFAASEPVKLDAAAVSVSLRRIEYKPNPAVADEDTQGADESEALWGKWDDSMQTVRPATEDDLALIAAADKAMQEYLANKAAEEAKGKKGKPVGPPPDPCRLSFAPSEDGAQNIVEVVPEPYSELVPDAEAQALSLQLTAVADLAKYKCQYENENVPFKPTYLFQSTTHRLTFTNECNISLPVSWVFDDIKRRTATTRAGTAQSRAMTAAAAPSIPCPFSIEPEECLVPPNSDKQFQIAFQPVDSDDFVYALKGETLSSPAPPPAAGEENAAPFRGPIRIVVRGSAKRPVCHFEVAETPDYLARRPPNMKNENGLFSPIEAADVRVVELESTGLKTRNTFRFHIINPTNENYEFLWEAVGDPSPSWRCVQSSGMLFGGKRIEIVFEYLPQETAVSESFFRFRLPKVGLDQLFLFSGKVKEPRVFFSSSRMDFHSVMLGGEGSSETLYLENKEHLPFNFAFDKMSMLQLEGTRGPVLDVFPRQGTVAPNSRAAISFLFKPQEEVVYNFNLVCEVKRKPNKLSINIKGEGYAVHPVIQLEQSEENLQGNRFLTLRPAPAINYADFGSVQVLDTLAKTVTVVNNGKYNFDFLWDTENIGPMLTLGGGKVGGTLHKGESASYVVTFAPQREASLDGASLSLTVAGKYLYEIYARGMAVSPALRFSFMQHDFGNCFVTSPGGSTVVEEAVLRLVNHDPTNNITVECQFQKTRALWAECLPTVLEPGGSLDVPIRFAPRDVKDYTFVVPFVVNGTSKVNVMILGKGINARLEMVTASQRRTNFGLVNVGSEVRKIVALVNRSKRALPVQLTEEAQYGAETLADRCVQFFPSSEFVIAPRETAQVQLVFAPNRRIPTFSQDLMVRYAGTTRKLLTVSGKAQGVEVALDTDSLPFGSVVIDSQKAKKLTLENSGDIGITFNWLDATLGKHFTIAPMSGKVLPNSEMQFDVTFRPKNLDDDINQSGMTLLVPGLPPLTLTCTGACIAQPDELTQTLQFSSLARKAESKAVKMTNPTDKDWFLSPSLNGENWRIPREVKVPAKGSADMTITYFPLTMSPAPAKEPAEGEPDSAHKGQLFVSLPDGSAALYKLRGYAGPPECSGQLSVETPAKKPAQLSIKVNNWLAQPQRLQVAVELLEQPSPATFVIAANAVEVGPNGTKEFPLRFLSFTEGQSKARITFTNASGEYLFYDLTAKATMPEVLETVSLESSASQSARTVLTLENPLPASATVSLAGGAKPDDWWSCDSPCIRVKELSPLSGNTEGSFEVEYRPLAPTTQPAEHLVSIMTKELGTFKYKVVVTATAAAKLPTLRFSVPLGSVATESLSFKAFNTAKADYSCVSKRPDFISLPKTVPVEAVADWAGTDVAVPVTFEPTELGETQDTVTITAPGGIEYVCSVVAECVAPTPQGPFAFVRGQTQDVSFRNFLAAPCAWNFSLDSSAFRTSAPNANVPAKSQGVATVVFDPKEEHANAPGGVVTAKLFVKCATRPELAPFIFYLRGNLAGGSAVEAAQAGKKK